GRDPGGGGLLPGGLELQQSARTSLAALPRSGALVLPGTRARPTSAGGVPLGAPSGRRRVGPCSASSRWTLLDLLPRPRRRYLGDDRAGPAWTVEHTMVTQTGRGTDRPLPPVGRGPGLPDPCLGQEQIGGEQPTHPAQDEPRRATTPGQGHGGGGRWPRPWLVHAGGPPTPSSARLPLDLRPCRRCVHGVAGGVALAHRRRPLRVPNRSGTKGRSGQRTAPSRVGGHFLRGGVVPPLPGPRGPWPGRTPSALELEGRRVARHRRRRRQPLGKTRAR